MDNPNLSRAAETHFVVRAMLINKLKEQKLMGPAIAANPDCATYFDYWRKIMSDRFFDMGTLIRAAASVETGLRDHYMQKKGHKNLLALHADPQYQQNIFQRVMPWHGANGAIALFKSISIDLVAIGDFPRVQELVLHRHLYAHAQGVIDDQYIKNLKTLTGRDLLAEPDVKAKYPAEDFYWFEPLSRLTDLIHAAQNLFKALT